MRPKCNKEQEKNPDALLKQAEFWYKLFNDRRNFEWKITLGFWAAILASIKFLIGEPKSILFIKLLIVFGVLVIWVHFIWLEGIWKANKKDKDKIILFADEAGYLSLPFKYKEEKKNQESCWKDWSFKFQFLTTIILVLGAIVFITLPFISCGFKLFANWVMVLPCR